VHTANTFRTKRRSVGADWERLAYRAIEIARRAVPAGHRIAASLAPLEDCYRPDLSPADPRPEHRELAKSLARAGADLILCETFPHVGEALIAVEASVATGLPTWVAFTAGPDGTLLSPIEVERGAREAIALGASAVLVNCVAATRTLPYVERLATLGHPFGAYANAGGIDEGLGWSSDARAADAYAAHAQTWLDAGATLVGGCCGTGPSHIAALRRLRRSTGR
jgi:S-methylmethionine-dependent homocysteine/selenocysteine methylase